MIVDVSNPSSPIQVGYLKTCNALGIYTLENYAHIADGRNGLVIMDDIYEYFQHRKMRMANVPVTEDTVYAWHPKGTWYADIYHPGANKIGV